MWPVSCHAGAARAPPTVWKERKHDSDQIIGDGGGCGGRGHRAQLQSDGGDRNYTGDIRRYGLSNRVDASNVVTVACTRGEGHIAVVIRQGVAGKWRRVGQALGDERTIVRGTIHSHVGGDVGSRIPPHQLDVAHGLEEQCSRQRQAGRRSGGRNPPLEPGGRGRAAIRDADGNREGPDLARRPGNETVGVNGEAGRQSASLSVAQGVAVGIRNDYSFPTACTIRFRFAAKGSRPALDLFWYDGGIKPPTPEELDEDGRELAPEGMLFVGDKGKILAGFRCDDPTIIPYRKAREFRAANGPTLPPQASDHEKPVWLDAFRGGAPTFGSFTLAAPISDAFNLAAVSLRLGGQRLAWDAASARITNRPQANALLGREYRKGWELLA